MITSSLSFHERYNGQLTEIDTIERALKDYEALLIQIDRLGNYAELRLSVDTTDEAAQTLNAKLNTSYGKIASRLSFVESEISIPLKVLLTKTFLSKSSTFPFALTIPSLFTNFSNSSFESNFKFF